jgi:hypothetical protein
MSAQNASGRKEMRRCFAKEKEKKKAKRKKKKGEKVRRSTGGSVGHSWSAEKKAREKNTHHLSPLSLAICSIVASIWGGERKMFLFTPI